jgi:hypothetical protein
MGLVQVITLLFAAISKKASIAKQNNKEIEKAEFQMSLPKKATQGSNASRGSWKR